MNEPIPVPEQLAAKPGETSGEWFERLKLNTERHFAFDFDRFVERAEEEGSAR